jgi:hypothetical protein
MTASMRCRLTGCDLDPCGVCRRCETEKDTTHDWQDTDRDRACFRKQACAKCGREREQPDHDWEPGVAASGEPSLTCSRCGLEI